MAVESAKANLILAVQSRIDDTVTDIVHIDEDNGQLEDVDPKTNRPPCKFPFAGIDIDITNAEDMGQNEQEIEADIVIRLALPPYSLAAQWFSAAVKEKALKIHEIEQELYKNLHGWVPEKFGALSFKSSRRIRREDAIREREIRYTTSWTDMSAGTYYQQTDVQPGSFDTGMG